MMGKKLKSTNELISEMRRMLRKPTLTLENMVFDEDDKNYYDSENGKYSDNMHGRVKDIPGREMTRDEESANDAVSKIRRIALGRIAQLSNDPTSSEYDLMKRIWNLCDKSLDTGGTRKHVNDDSEE